MKRTILLGLLITILISLLSYDAYSQRYRRRGQGLQFGVTGGLSLSNIHTNYIDKSSAPYNRSRLGFQLGATLDISFGEGLSFQPGLRYATKGYGIDLEKQQKEALKQTVGSDFKSFEVDGFSRTTYHYLEIPLCLTYRSENLMIYGGPYLAFNLGGKQKTKADISYTVESIMGDDVDANSEIDSELKYKPTFGDVDPADLETNETGVSAVDFGLDFGAGIHFEPMLIKFGYSLGLGNLTTGFEGSDYDPADDYKANRVFYVSLTYFLAM